MSDLSDGRMKGRRVELVRYALAIVAALALALVLWLAVQALLGPDEAVVIQVVPIGEPGRIRVQVEGAVARPGVYELPDGATMTDAVAEAGGAVDGGSLDPEQAGTALRDGELVVVRQSQQAVQEEIGPININTAGVSELEALPGIGPVIAQRIVEFRRSNGNFASVDDLAAVSGVSDRMVGEMRHMIVVESD